MSVDAAALREVVERIAGDWAVPGGVVAVTDRTGLLFEYAFGWADRERGIRTRPDHLFEIGSISKIFTAAIVLGLADEGLLRRDQPIGEVLDWLPAPLDGPDITIERLLQHAAGLVSGVDAVPDQVAQAAGFTGTVSSADPGTFFHYSNLGFILLGLAAQEVTGRPLAELERERLFDPLGMPTTRGVVTNDDRAALALGYRALHDDRFVLPGDELIVADWLEVDGADGAIAATAADLAAFARALLDVDRAPFAEMATRLGPAGEETVQLAGLAPAPGSRYGLGVNVETTDGRVVLTHGGGMVGYASFLLADRAAGIGVAVLTNADGVGPIAEVVARAVAAIAIADAVVPPLEPTLWAAAGSADDTRPRGIDERMLGRFVGDPRAGSGPSSGPAGLVVRSPGPGRLELDAGNGAHPLSWSWGEPIGTSDPVLRPHPLRFDGRDWTWGPRRYRPDGVVAPAAPTAAASPCVGRYRTYSPWLRTFRIVEREGTLLLLCPPAVEAPGDETELVEVAPGVLRIGADPRLPERLHLGPLVDGRCAWVERDGCRYSRSFRD